MNPMEKIEALAKSGRDFRSFVNFELRAADEGKIVDGVACVFNRETVLYEFDGVQYKEKVDPLAFSEADMSDVIFNYNHGGRVLARTRNKTLQLSVETDGLHCRVDLGGTEAGQKMYEEIRGGYIDRMSYAYTVQEASYDSSQHLRTIRKIKKLYDVSAVDFPAYDTTVISARSLLDLDRAEQERAAALMLRKRKLYLFIDAVGGAK